MCMKHIQIVFHKINTFIQKCIEHIVMCVMIGNMIHSEYACNSSNIIINNILLDRIFLSTYRIHIVLLSCLSLPHTT